MRTGATMEEERKRDEVIQMWLKYHNHEARHKNRVSESYSSIVICFLFHVCLHSEEESLYNGLGKKVMLESYDSSRQ